MLATGAKTINNMEKVEKTTKIKPEKIQTRRGVSDYFSFLLVLPT